MLNFFSGINEEVEDMVQSSLGLEETLQVFLAFSAEFKVNGDLDICFDC